MPVLFVQFKRLATNGDPVHAGSIQWDGNKFHCEPKDFKDLLQTPIKVGDRMVHAITNPEEWIKNLNREYKSPYFQASACETITDAEARGEKDG